MIREKSRNHVPMILLNQDLETEESQSNHISKSTL